jgi:hypothetical protein
MGEHRLLAVWRYFPDTEVCRAARPDPNIDVALVIQGDACDACTTRAVLTGLDIRAQWQECQGRLRAIRGDLTDLSSAREANIDMAMAIDLDALRRLRNFRVEEDDGINLGSKGARRDEGAGNGQWDET